MSPRPAAMNALYLLYDRDCPVSLRHREWLAKQAAIVPLHGVAHQAEEVLRRFPGIAAHLTPRQLTAVSDNGQLWTGPSAVVMCLFALEKYRELAERLALPNLLPYARTALELLSREVFEMNHLLRCSPPMELENLLRLNAEAARNYFHPPPVPPTTQASAGPRLLAG